jgi:hypothetical protein
MLLGRAIIMINSTVNSSASGFPSPVTTCRKAKRVAHKAKPPISLFLEVGFLTAAAIVTANVNKSTAKIATKKRHPVPFVRRLWKTRQQKQPSDTSRDIDGLRPVAARGKPQCRFLRRFGIPTACPIIGFR